MSAVAYECDTHGQILECDVDESGGRVCPDCGRHVDVVTDQDALPDGGADQSGAVLRFDGDIVDRQKITRACELLHDAGVAFDTGIDVSDSNNPVQEWFLDWSLTGATLDIRGGPDA